MTTSPGNRGRHEFKVGASFIYEPTLDITFSTGQQPLFTHLTDSRTSPISSITYNGSLGEGGLSRRVRSRTTSTRFYIQDAWRVTDKLNLDLGVRYDLITGFAFDQEEQPVLRPAAGRRRAAGHLAGLPGLRGLRQGAEGGHEQHRPPRSASPTT